MYQFGSDELYKLNKASIGECGGLPCNNPLDPETNSQIIFRNYAWGDTDIIYIPSKETSTEERYFVAYGQSIDYKGFIKS